MGEFDYEKTYKAWKWDIPKKYNIGVDVIDKHAASKNRNKVALYWENAAGDTERYTFGDLKVLSDKFGNVLKKLGFKKGDRFLIRLPNIPAFQIAFLGGVKIGAVPTNGMNHYCCLINKTSRQYRFLQEIPDYSEMEVNPSTE